MNVDLNTDVYIFQMKIYFRFTEIKNLVRGRNPKGYNVIIIGQSRLHLTKLEVSIRELKHIQVTNERKNTSVFLKF